jgi:hypothetical protein
MSANFSEVIKDLPSQRKKDLTSLRKILRAQKPKEVKETLEGTQLVYTLPLRHFKDSYNKRPLLYATLTDRKGYISLNLICIHNDRKRRGTFVKKLLKTGACIGATGCCYKIKTVNQELIALLETELARYDCKKFVETFLKFRQK